MEIFRFFIERHKALAVTYKFSKSTINLEELGNFGHIVNHHSKMNVPKYRGCR